jgi:hypothetical protein
MIVRGARTPFVLAMALAAGVLGAACDVSTAGGGFNVGLASGRAADEWARTYTVSPGARLIVKNVNGLVSVETSAEANTIEVRAERIAKSSTDEAARALLQKIEIFEEAKPDRVTIETRAPKTWGRDGHEVKYTIKVPSSVVVEARTVNGGVRLTGLANEVVARTVNGGIDAERLSGHLDASTTNGGIDVGLQALAAGGVQLETVNGGIQLSLPKDAKADISARVVNGGMHTDALAIETTGERNKRRLEGKLNGGGSRVELATTNGGIHLSSSSD